MSTEILLTARDLEERYSLARSNVYGRLKGLKNKGYDVDPIKQGARSFYSSEQIELMDRLDEHLKSGNDISTFPPADSAALSRHPTGQQDRTQDFVVRRNPSGLEVVGAIAQRLTEVIEARSVSPADPLASMRAIQEVCDKGWLLSTGQLAPLLGLKTLLGKEFTRYGFTFKRVGKNGAQSAWKITKGQQP